MGQARTANIGWATCRRVSINFGKSFLEGIFMLGRKGSNGGYVAAPLIAVAVISVVGLLFCVIIGTAFSRDPTVPLAVVGVAVFLLLYIVISLSRSDVNSSAKILGAIHQKEETVHHYRFGKIVKKKKTKNEPPTVETIREIKRDAGIIDFDIPPDDDPKS